MSASKSIKIFFVSFWKGFDPYNNFFLDVLKLNFNLIVTPVKPDIIIHSVFNNDFLKYNCIRVGYTGENIRPDLKYSDYYIGFDYLDSNRYLRWPLFLFATPLHQLINTKNADEIIKQERKFAAFVVSNPNAKERIEFFKKLSEYKTVSSGGGVLNNIGYRVNDLYQFLSEHKFTIAFENSSYPGYTTEKLTQAMRVGSIPIYWGDPKIEEFFNTKSFVNLQDFKSIEDAIEYVKEIDSNPKLYRKVLSEPWFKNDTPPRAYMYEVLYSFFEMIFDNTKEKHRKTSFVGDRVRYLIGKNRIIKKIISAIKLIVL